ncbi:MAG: MerR family transcriptional regulator, partial [Xenococcus sp. (in: cyanobacteria)]
SIYYSQSDLVQLALMEYLLSVGLSFATASWGLKELIKTDADYANSETKKRWMLCWENKQRSLVLEEFTRDKAISFLDKGQFLIPIWLEKIHQQLGAEISK